MKGLVLLNEARDCHIDRNWCLRSHHGDWEETYVHEPEEIVREIMKGRASWITQVAWVMPAEYDPKDEKVTVAEEMAGDFLLFLGQQFTAMAQARTRATVVSQ